MAKASPEPRTVFTIGHSTHPLHAFLALLRRHGVETLVDVRRFPGSRRVPHFGADALRESLAREHVHYVHESGLGGRRAVAPASPNGGWENNSFQGYADHMASDDFARALAELEVRADEALTAVMCAEALWWRCHRRLLADALVARGRAVSHVMPDGRLTSHELTPFAVSHPDGGLTYPPAQGELIPED